MTHTFDILFREPSKGHPPGPSRAYVYVKSHTSDEEGYIFITPDCVSLVEFEAQINRLKEELEAIRKKAKEKFAKPDK